MLLERPLSLKLIFHYYNQFKSLFFSFFFFYKPKLINREIELYEWAMYLRIFFSLFHFAVFVAGLFLFSFFFLLFFQHVALSSSFFFFSVLFVSVCSCFFFLLFSGGLEFSLIVSVETQSVTISWRYDWFLAPNRGLLYTHLHVHAAS